MSASLPRAFGRYALLSSLGRGGMGEVFLARHGALAGAERLCVVKTLRGDLATNTEYLGRFLDEARIVVQLSHAGICHVFDAGRVGDDVYIAMEFIPGVNVRLLLSALHDAGSSLTTSLALHLASEVLDALAYAHRLRHRTTGVPLHVVHRDVSPHNVMVSFEGEVKLIDFGLAESDIKEEHTATQQVLGKVAYMSPEQARGDSVDAATDQFASAIMLYEMLAHDRFYGEMTTHQIWQIVGLGGFTPRHFDRIPAPIVPILLRALAPTTAERYPSCDELRDAIDDVRATHFPGSGKRDLRQLLRTTFAAKVVDIERLIARASTLQVSVPDEESGSRTGIDAASIAATVELPLAVDSSPERRADTQPSKARAPTASEARAIDLAPSELMIGPHPPSTDLRENAAQHTETAVRPNSVSDFSAAPETDSQSSAFASGDASVPTPSSSMALATPPAEVSSIEHTWQAEPVVGDDTSRVLRAANATTSRRRMAIAAVALAACAVLAVLLIARDDSGEAVPVVATLPVEPMATTPPDVPPTPPVEVRVPVEPDTEDPVVDESKPDAPPEVPRAAQKPTKTSKPRRGEKPRTVDAAERPVEEPVATRLTPSRAPDEPTPAKPGAVEVKPATAPATAPTPPAKKEPTVAEMLSIVRDCKASKAQTARGLLVGKSAADIVTPGQVELVRTAAKHCAPHRF